jgi:hypothetical protein
MEIKNRKEFVDNTRRTIQSSSMYLRITGLFFLFFFLPFKSFSQDKVHIEVDSTQIKIGNQVTATLKVELEPGEQVRFPNIEKFLTDNIEVIGVSEIDTQKINAINILRQTLTLTSFDSGNHIIPALKFISRNATNKIDTFSTREVLLRVDLVEVDTLAAIKDIKAPVDTPFHNNELWSYLNYLMYLIIFIVVVLIAVQYFKLNKVKPKPEVIVPVAPEEPADSIAMRELEQLKKKKDWNTIEGVKDFHEDISLILRKYIQKRFKMPALERTSNEIMNDIKNRPLDKELIKSLNQILVLSDYVKFAKYKPSVEENEKSLENSFSFIKKTPAENFANKTNA